MIDDEPYEEYLSDLDDDYEPVDATADPDIAAFLIEWTLEFNIKRNALNKLLRFLNNNFCPKLPIDSRTLLQTPQKRNEIAINPGRYVHIGIKENLDNFLSNIPELQEISLDFNIDGVPISRSSNSCFWPILCKPYHSKGKVFTVGIYHGYNKPNLFSEFLRPFMDELISVTSEFQYESRPIRVSVRAFICDTPARCGVTGTKSHTGYSGCGKCTQQGEYIDHQMTFPETDVVLRTNESFRNLTDEDHHVTTTPILELESIDMVKQFPLDYLHLVLLGVVRKLLNMWIKGKPPILLPSYDVRSISQRLINIS